MSKTGCGATTDVEMKGRNGDPNSASPCLSVAVRRFGALPQRIWYGQALGEVESQKTAIGWYLVWIVVVVDAYSII